LDAKRGENAVGDAFANFVGDGPLQTLGPLGGSDDNGSVEFPASVARRLFATGWARRTKRPRLHRLVMGDHQTNTLGEKRGVDGRLGDPASQRISAAQSSMAAANSSVGISRAWLKG